MSPSRKRLIIFGSITLFFMILAFVLFLVAGNFRGDYSTTQVAYVSASVAGNADMVSSLNARLTSLNTVATVLSVGAYISSILAIVALGVGLAVNDKMKEKEESYHDHEVFVDKRESQAEEEKEDK
ncbi:MAG: hypothetical protein Q4F15_05130 [Bacillota bacterium]|nr:hypothetical protein [Bacillota bacterium]